MRCIVYICKFNKGVENEKSKLCQYGYDPVNCVNTVSKALNNSNKIQEATVNLATEKAKVIFDDTLVIKT